MAPVLLLSPKPYKISSSCENPSSTIGKKQSSQQKQQQSLLISTITTTAKLTGNKNKLLATTTTTTTTTSNNYFSPSTTTITSSRSSTLAIFPTNNSKINNSTPTVNSNSNSNNSSDNNSISSNINNNNNNKMFKRSTTTNKLNNNNNHNNENIKPINISNSGSNVNNNNNNNNNAANVTNNNIITNNGNSTIVNNSNLLIESKPIIKSKQQLQQQQQQRQEQLLQLSPPLRSFAWTKHNSIAPAKSISTASINTTASKSTASKPSSSPSPKSTSHTSTSKLSSSKPSSSSSASSSSSSSNNVKNNRKNIIVNQENKSLQGILNKTHRTEREIKISLSKLRRLILVEGLPEEDLPKLSPSMQNLIRPDSLRSTIWKRLLGVYYVSANDYVRLIKKGKSCVYEKIRNDTFRTMATDQKFLERVNEEMLTRLLNATAWKMKISGNQSISYVQGMNVLAAPFLFTMSELDAFYSFVTFIQNCCPLYVTPNLQGVHCGIKLLEKCLKIIDVKLFDYLKSKELTAVIYALPSVLTFCACTPPLDQLLKLWDFLFAYGVHLNILCIIAQLVLMRDQLLEAPSPMKLLRTMPKLDAKSIINLTVKFVQKIPDDLYDLLVRHPFDPTVESLIVD